MSQTIVLYDIAEGVWKERDIRDLIEELLLSDFMGDKPGLLSEENEKIIKITLQIEVEEVDLNA